MAVELNPDFVSWSTDPESGPAAAGLRQLHDLIAGLCWDLAALGLLVAVIAAAVGLLCRGRDYTAAGVVAARCVALVAGGLLVALAGAVMGAKVP